MWAVFHRQDTRFCHKTFDGRSGRAEALWQWTRSLNTKAHSLGKKAFQINIDEPSAPVAVVRTKNKHCRQRSPGLTKLVRAFYHLGRETDAFQTHRSNMRSACSQEVLLQVGSVSELILKRAGCAALSGDLPDNIQMKRMRRGWKIPTSPM